MQPSEIYKMSASELKFWSKCAAVYASQEQVGFK